MKHAAIIYLCLTLASCYTIVSCTSLLLHSRETIITPDQTTWIEKGTTTRAEIEERFGPPFSETVDFSEYKIETKTHTTITDTTTTENEREQTSVTTVKTKWIMLRKALWYHTKVSGFACTPRVKLTWFFVKYDDEGIVRDFGFEPGP